MKRFIILTCFMMLTFQLFSLDINFKKVYRNIIGKNNYKKENMDKALNTFEKNAIDYPNNSDLRFNLGNAFYKKGKYNEALKEYQIALNDKESKIQDKILHNMANIYFQNKDYENALSAYRKSLIKNPNNDDTRKNYELTKRLLLQQQQQKDQNQNNDNNEEKKDQQKQQNNPEQNQQQEQQKIDAQNLLKAIEEKEKEDLKKKKQNQGSFKTGKYW